LKDFQDLKKTFAQNILRIFPNKHPISNHPPKGVDVAHVIPFAPLRHTFVIGICVCFVIDGNM
jgi:uncharacterized protein (DUF2062 family)